MSDWNSIIRPRAEYDFVGQGHILTVIRNSYLADRYPKFSIFTGPPGVGKSSIAEWVANMLVCKAENSPCGECDICQAATMNNYPGIRKHNMAKISQQGNVNEVLAEIFEFESFAERNVYILEEVQELDTHKEQSPWLEELMHIPDDVYIIMCTTQPYRLRQELRDRAQIFELEIPDEESCYGLIRRCALTFNFPIPDGETCKSIIALNRNNPRLIISCLELLSSAGEITAESLEKYYSVVDTAVYIRVFAAIFDTSIDLFTFVGQLEEIAKKHKLVSVLRGLKEFCMRTLIELSVGTTDFTLNKADRATLKDIVNTLGHAQFLAFMQKLGAVPTERISTKDSAEYELTMLKNFGLQKAPTASRKQSQQDAGAERDKAMHAARVYQNSDNVPRAIKEMTAEDFLAGSTMYQEVVAARPKIPDTMPCGRLGSPTECTDCYTQAGSKCPKGVPLMK